MSARASAFFESAISGHANETENRPRALDSGTRTAGQRRKNHHIRPDAAHDLPGLFVSLLEDDLPLEDVVDGAPAPGHGLPGNVLGCEHRCVLSCDSDCRSDIAESLAAEQLQFVVADSVRELSRGLARFGDDQAVVLRIRANKVRP